MTAPKRPPSRTAAPTASKRGSSTGGRAAKPKQASGSAASPGRGSSGAATTRTRRTATTAAKGARSAAGRTGRAATGTAARGGAARGMPAGEGIVSLAEQVARGSAKPRDLILLTRERIQEALDDAAERGRLTRKDANELVSELVRRGRAQGDDLIAELETLVGRGGEQLRSVTRRARLTEPVERLVRGADRVRRSAGVGSSFPIIGYDRLNATQVRGRIKELSKPELRKVLTYERNHANRKTVVAALEKAIR